MIYSIALGSKSWPTPQEAVVVERFWNGSWRTLSRGLVVALWGSELPLPKLTLGNTTLESLFIGSSSPIDSLRPTCAARLASLFEFETGATSTFLTVEFFELSAHHFLVAVVLDSLGTFA